jgi:ketosteroid isomerase-like protein
VVAGLLLLLALALGPVGCQETVWVEPDDGSVQEGPFDAQVYWASDMVPSTLRVSLNNEEITGKSAARQRLADKLKDYSYSFSTESKEENQVGPGWIIDWGSYVSAVTDNKTGDVVNDVGSYLSVWKKCEDGKWRIAYDIWNSDRLAPTTTKK